MKHSTPLAITISRQLGSGGAHIGQQLAKNLNIAYVDRDIIDLVAKKFSILAKDMESRDEKIISSWQTFLQSITRGPDAYIPRQPIAPTDKELHNAETEIIERLSTERSAVIIGRCGCYILRQHPNHVSIFLHASLAFRTARVQQLYNLSEAGAAKMITENDKKRALYYHTFTGKEWADAKQYDLSIDTGKIGLENSIKLITEYLAQRQTEL
jgi:cytidylate kinase